MSRESRLHKSMLNARVSLMFYFVFIVLSFFSRKIFLESLGADFIGLSGTLSNILGFLSLAEMGVSSAVAYNLYKPIEQRDKLKMEELVSVFGYLYRKIGLFIFLVGIVISLFIPLIFKHTLFHLTLIYTAFYCILASSLLSYFINYKQILLTADQKGYMVTGYLQGASVVKTLIQMYLAYKWESYYLWIMMELIFGFISCIILNMRIKKTYPWLNVSVLKGKECYYRYKYIVAFTKKVFIHKIKDFLLTQSDQILVFAFVSLKMVAFYGNYILVVSRVSSAFDSALNSFGAGVGNLVAEGDKERSIHVFWELVSVRFFIAGFLIYSIYNFIESFISLWLGPQYIMERTILLLLVVNIFITQTRGAVDMFNTAYGHYADTWAAWAELLLNLTITFITAPFWGISGILLGKIISTVAIIIFWKPYYLFKVGFKKSIFYYWRIELRYYFSLFLSLLLGYYLFKIVPIEANSNFLNWTLKAVICITVYVIIYFTLLMCMTPGTRYLYHRIISKKPFFKT